MAPKSPRAAVQATKDIREGVRKELDFDPLVDASHITVENMNGDVALNGTVTSYPQLLQAAAAARRVRGVTKVHNHLMVQLPPWGEHDAVIDAAWRGIGVKSVRDELVVTG